MLFEIVTSVIIVVVLIGFFIAWVKDWLFLIPTILLSSLIAFFGYLVFASLIPKETEEIELQKSEYNIVRTEYNIIIDTKDLYFRSNNVKLYNTEDEYIQPILVIKRNYHNGETKKINVKYDKEFICVDMKEK